MAIRSVVTRGFGNGTFIGTIPLVVTMGFAIGAALAAIPTPTDPGVIVSEDGRTVAVSAIKRLIAVSEDTRVIQQS